MPVHSKFATDDDLFSAKRHLLNPFKKDGSPIPVLIVENRNGLPSFGCRSCISKLSLYSGIFYFDGTPVFKDFAKGLLSAKKVLIEEDVKTLQKYANTKLSSEQIEHATLHVLLPSGCEEFELNGVVLAHYQTYVKPVSYHPQWRSLIGGSGFATILDIQRWFNKICNWRKTHFDALKEVQKKLKAFTFCKHGKVLEDAEAALSQLEDVKNILEIFEGTSDPIEAFTKCLLKDLKTLRTPKLKTLRTNWLTFDDEKLNANFLMSRFSPRTFAVDEITQGLDITNKGCCAIISWSCPSGKKCDVDLHAFLYDADGEECGHCFYNNVSVKGAILDHDDRGEDGGNVMCEITSFDIKELIKNGIAYIKIRIHMFDTNASPEKISVGFDMTPDNHGNAVTESPNWDGDEEYFFDYNMVLSEYTHPKLPSNTCSIGSSPLDFKLITKNSGSCKIETVSKPVNLIGSTVCALAYIDDWKDHGLKNAYKEIPLPGAHATIIKEMGAITTGKIGEYDILSMDVPGHLEKVFAAEELKFSFQQKDFKQGVMNKFKGKIYTIFLKKYLEAQCFYGFLTTDTALMVMEYANFDLTANSLLLVTKHPKSSGGL